MAVDSLQLPDVALPVAIAMGLIHGTEPGHGWLLAVLHSLRNGGMPKALTYTTILAVGHFVSTLVVVGAVWLLKSTLEQYLLALQVIAALLLILFGGRMLVRHFTENDDHEHEGPSSWDFTEMFKYAFLLGFAHEEEIALAGFILVGANPLVLIVSYSLAVYLSMIIWAVASFYLVSKIPRLESVLERNVHIISALILMGVGFLVMVEALREVL